MNEWKPKRSLRENLRLRMPVLVAEYFAAGHAALTPGTSWEEMHQFRLQTKRFRYTLEIFRPAYGPGIERRVEMLRHVQSLLGDVNDCVVTAAMLETMSGTDGVRARLAFKAESKTAQLKAFWGKEFQALGRQQFWQRYLTQYACRTSQVSRAPVVQL